MFEDSCLYICAKNQRIYKFDIDVKTKSKVAQSFSNATQNLINCKDKIDFDGNYKPERNECLRISHFNLHSDIKEAIQNPIGVDSFLRQNGKFPEIAFIFMGGFDETGHLYVSFQLFRKEQYLVRRGINLFYNSDSFKEEKSFGVNITDIVDCYYFDSELLFPSFYFAKQIFDLNQYYREATDKEVMNFTRNGVLAFENADDFVKLANTWVRRRIALINDAGILENFTATEIEQKANQLGLHLRKQENKILIPNDKKQIKAIIGFLNEEAYQGAFSEALYLANSKRKVNLN